MKIIIPKEGEERRDEDPGLRAIEIPPIWQGQTLKTKMFSQ